MLKAYNLDGTRSCNLYVCQDSLREAHYICIYRRCIWTSLVVADLQHLLTNLAGGECLAAFPADERRRQTWLSSIRSNKGEGGHGNASCNSHYKLNILSIAQPKRPTSWLALLSLWPVTNNHTSSIIITFCFIGGISWGNGNCRHPSALSWSAGRWAGGVWRRLLDCTACAGRGAAVGCRDWRTAERQWSERCSQHRAQYIKAASVNL